MEEKRIYLCSSKELSLKNTFECGQCFRWIKGKDGSYTGISGENAARIFEHDGGIYIQTNNGNSEYWHEYFDLSRDYSKINRELCIDDFMRRAIAFGAGIRILKQDEWEALCSFIISQCNNIPRIKGIISKLCERYGKEVCIGDTKLYTFPNSQQIAELDYGSLEFLRAGYRVPYIIDAARAVASGMLLFEELRDDNTANSRKVLMKQNGIGPKVADCFLLFGLGKLDAFPVDTWIKKAQKFYDGALNYQKFGRYAGIAQQYIFYYVKETQINK